MIPTEDEHRDPIGEDGQHRGQAFFGNELDKAIAKATTEFRMTNAEVIGVLACKSMELWFSAQDEDGDEGE